VVETSLASTDAVDANDADGRSGTGKALGEQTVAQPEALNDAVRSGRVNRGL